MGRREHTVSIFAPVLHITVTIEQGSQGQDEIHVHPGGQGFWIARMLRHLGERPLLSGPVGGEVGQVFRGLLAQWGMEVSAIQIADSTPITITDRRGGDREVVASSPGPSLARHEVDDWYGRFLDHSLACGICVITGQPDRLVNPDLYKRLGHDLAAADVRVVADLHGEELREFLEGGPIDILKVSDEDLHSDGMLPSADASQADCLDAIHRLIESGVSSVVLSRQHDAALARFGDRTLMAKVPELDPADFRGAGDSMTAGLAAGTRRELPPEDLLRLACAAGAANVTRHGLGSADKDLITRLSERIEIHRLGVMS